MTTIFGLVYHYKNLYVDITSGVEYQKPITFQTTYVNYPKHLSEASINFIQGRLLIIIGEIPGDVHFHLFLLQLLHVITKL